MLEQTVTIRVRFPERQNPPSNWVWHELVDDFPHNVQVIAATAPIPTEPMEEDDA